MLLPWSETESLQGTVLRGVAPQTRRVHWPGALLEGRARPIPDPPDQKLCPTGAPWWSACTEVWDPRREVPTRGGWAEPRGLKTSPGGCDTHPRAAPADWGASLPSLRAGFSPSMCRSRADARTVSEAGALRDWGPRNAGSAQSRETARTQAARAAGRDAAPARPLSTSQNRKTQLWVWSR